MTAADTHPQPDVRDPREFVAYLLDDLVIDSTSQRGIDDERVRKIAHDFDWLRFEVPSVVALDNGRARVIEGQHRCLALRLIADETTVVTCAVLPVPPGEVVEASIAYAIAKGRQGHSALARWLLLVHMQSPHELAAEAVLRERGLRLGASPDVYTISAVATVSRIVHGSGSRRSPEVGAELLGRVVDVLARAFPPDVEAVAARWDWRIMRAVGDLIARNDEIRDERLVKVLADRNAQKWIANAMSISDQPVWSTIAEIIAQRYNRNISDGKIA